jgi:hypothetical protein
MPTDAANVIASVNRRQSLIAEAFHAPTRDSLYSGVPRSSAVNLYNINLKNLRENSLYSFQ